MLVDEGRLQLGFLELVALVYFDGRFLRLCEPL